MTPFFRREREERMIKLRCETTFSFDYEFVAKLYNVLSNLNLMPAAPDCLYLHKYRGGERRKG